MKLTQAQWFVALRKVVEAGELVAQLLEQGMAREAWELVLAARELVSQEPDPPLPDLARQLQGRVLEQLDRVLEELRPEVAHPRQERVRRERGGLSR